MGGRDFVPRSLTGIRNTLTEMSLNRLSIQTTLTRITFEGAERNAAREQTNARTTPNQTTFIRLAYGLAACTTRIASTDHTRTERSTSKPD
jgi:hypothetical protein